jgi:hypothetical protein
MAANPAIHPKWRWQWITAQRPIFSAILSKSKRTPVMSSDGRGGGKDPCVEFKSGHAKFLSALNAHLLPDLGSSHRAQQAAEAYKEFLHGLQLIGAQETINQHGVHSKNILELYNWERQIQGAVRVAQYGACGTCMGCLHLCNNDTHSPPSFSTPPPFPGLTARANCRTTYLFNHNLRERVQLPMSSKPGECSFDKVPIRAATRAYLTRPVEKDFTLVGVLMYMVTCCVYGVSLCTSAAPPVPPLVSHTTLAVSNLSALLRLSPACPLARSLSVEHLLARTRRVYVPVNPVLAP